MSVFDLCWSDWQEYAERYSKGKKLAYKLAYPASRVQCGKYGGFVNGHNYEFVSIPTSMRYGCAKKMMAIERNFFEYVKRNCSGKKRTVLDAPKQEELF